MLGDRAILKILKTQDIEKTVCGNVIQLGSILLSIYFLFLLYKHINLFASVVILMIMTSCYHFKIACYN
jgi:hypothetical protein